MKWIEIPNGGLINAEYITNVMPIQGRISKDSPVSFEIDIYFLGDERYNRIVGFENKEHRDSRLEDLKCFLKNCCAGTFIFKEKENN